MKKNDTFALIALALMFASEEEFKQMLGFTKAQMQAILEHDCENCPISDKCEKKASAADDATLQLFKDAFAQ